jgi:ABC-type branched-subunit amino acid transport system permease subunit
MIDSLGSTDQSSKESEAVGGSSISYALPAAFVLAVIAPFLLEDFYIFLLTTAFIFSIFSLSVDLVWGYGGIWVFGHAAFFGFGGYIMGKLLTEYQIPGMSYIGLALALVLPAIAGLLIAYALFSQGIDDFYFAIITLAIAMIAQQTALSLPDLTGGYNGISGIPPMELGIPTITTLSITGVPKYYFALLALTLAFLFARRSVLSPFGRVMVAISENPTKARSLGYNVSIHQTLTFGISCALAGFAGALYASHVGFLSPGLLGFLLSAEVIFWVLVGGRGTLIGAILGTVFLVVLENLLSGAFQFTWRLLLGILFIIIVLVFPDGIVGLLRNLNERITARMD